MKQLQLKKWMGPEDAGYQNHIHGGVILRLIDEAAGLAAIRYASGRVVTAALDAMSFLSPVYVGQLVLLETRINQVWRSSLEVEVDALTEDILTGQRQVVASAYLTMVALDDQGQPRPLTPYQPEGDEAKALAAAADHRRQQRLENR